MITIVNFFIKRKISTLCLNASILFLGIYCFNKTSIDLFPPVSLPTLTIITSAEGLSSMDIEKQITKPLEELFNNLPNLKSIRSESKSNQNIFLLKFEWNTSIDFAALHVRELLKSFSLPQEASEPLVLRWDPSQEPVLRADVFGSYSHQELTKLIENKIKPQLERIKGVATVDTSGTLHSEIKIKIDPHSLSAKNINLFQIIEALKQENIQRQVGTYQEGNYEMAIKLNSEFKSIEDVKQLPIQISPQKSLPLKDIASIEQNSEKRHTFARVLGQESIGLSIKKSHGAATLDVIKAVKETLTQFSSQNPKLSVVYAKDDSLYILTSRSILFSNFWQGTLLTFLVVLLFLQSLSATLIISASIPISILGTFALMQYFGISQNVFSLAGFTLAAGMVVDCSVIILENIYRQFKEEGKSPARAALEGTQEVWLGVLTSVLTTMAIFIPVVFCIKGIFGILFENMAFTFTISLALSLIVGFTLIPCASALLLKIESQYSKPLKIPFLSKMNFLGKKIQDFFLKHLSALLDQRGKALGVITFIYGFSLFCFFLLPGLDLIPFGEMKNFFMEIKGAPGTHVDYLESQTSRAEKELKRSFPNIDIVATQIDDQKSQSFITLKESFASASQGELYLQRIREKLNIPDMKIKILDIPKLDTTEGYGVPLVLIIKHKEPQKRKQIFHQLSQHLKDIPDVLYISQTEEKNKPEIHIDLDSRKVSDYGLTRRYLANMIYTHMHGFKATELSFLDQNLPIQVIHEKAQINIENLRELPVLSAVTQTPLPLKTFADIQETQGETTIEHTDNSASTTLKAHLKTDRRSLEDILAQINTILSSHPEWKSFISIESTLKVLKDTFSDLFLALVIAILLTYMILAAQFESLVQPLTLILTIPLISLGVLIGVHLWGLYLNIIVMLGIILLVGITVDAGILLIEYIQILRQRGMDRKEAILTAVRHRMRPIFITALTDILGTAPMAFSQGAGAEMYQGFGIVSLCGLTTATFLTLFTVPLTYSLVEDLGDYLSLRLLRIKTLVFRLNRA